MTLEDYAAQHGGTTQQFLAAAWQEVFHDERPALQFTTESGPRWRFLDDEKPKYDQPSGYRACWYGLKRALARQKGVIVDCNGAASTIVADANGVPAYSLQAGEETSPSEILLAQLSDFTGEIIVAFDNDAPSEYAPEGVGHRAAVKRVQLYREAGYNAYAVDLGLPPIGSDLADFCAIHQANSLERLTACKRLDIPVETPRHEHKRSHTDASELPALIELALKALHPSRADDRECWIYVGMAIHSALGEAAYSLWATWSQQSPKYKPKVVESTWKSFKREGKTLGTLFAYANEDCPGWRPIKYDSHEFDAAVDNASADLETVSDTADITDTQSRALLSYLGQQGPSTAKVFKAIMQSGEKSLTARQVSQLAQVPYSTTCKVLNTYAGHYLLDRVLTSDSTLPIDSTLVTKKTVAGENGAPVDTCATYLYTRPTSAELSVRLLERIIIPAELNKVFRPLSGLIHAPFKDMPGIDMTIAEAVFEGVIDSLDTAQRKAYDKARRKFDGVIAHWRKALADTTVTPEVEGTDWRKDYRASIAAKNFEKHHDTQQSWKQAYQATGIRRAALTKAEGRLGITRRDKYATKRLLCRQVDDLPAPYVWDDAYSGIPGQAIVGMTADGEYTDEYRVLDYHSTRVQVTLKARLTAGKPVWIGYQQASVLCYMNDEESVQYENRLLRAKEKKDAKDLQNIMAMAHPKAKRRVKREEKPIGWRAEHTLNWLCGVERLLKISVSIGATVDERLQHLLEVVEAQQEVVAVF